MPQQLTNEPLLTLPVDVLKNITKYLSPRDEAALKLTCKRMNLLLLAPPPPPLTAAAPALLAIRERDLIPPPARADGRATPLPQEPMPWEQATTLREIEAENAEVDDRERDIGMYLSDSEEDGVGGDRDKVEEAMMMRLSVPRPKKLKHKKSILSWTAKLDSAPATPLVTRSPSVASFAHSRPGSPGPAVPNFTVTTS